MVSEVWKDVPGYPNLQASNQGRVRSVGHFVCRKLKGTVFYPGMVLKPYRTGRVKRGQNYLSVSYGSSRPKVHRLVALAFIGCRTDEEINHKDGDKYNNCPENLEWIDCQGNMKHSVENGYHWRGEKHQNAKLTENQVKDIRRLYKSGITQKELSRRYGMSKPGIQCVCNGRTWKHLEI